MLIADTISELINADLPPARAREHIRQLSSIEVNSEILHEAIETIETFADGEAIRAVQGHAELLDCCGTGGSGLPHYNTSTTVAFILAAAGVKVAKFGNRAATSLAGSFDLLETLGISCWLQPTHFNEIISETNLVFLFVQQFYPALKKLGPIRQSLGIRTVFNLIGPLLNPTRPQFRLLGVPSRNEQEAIADYLVGREYCEKAFVMSSRSGLDELDPATVNRILEVEKGNIGELLLEREQSFTEDRRAILNPETNCRIFKAIIHNEADTFPYYYALVCLNAGAGLCVARKVSSVEEGIFVAADLLSSGEVLKKVEQCRRVYERYAS